MGRLVQPAGPGRGGELFTPESGTGLAATRFAKFSILLARPDRVYFQDSVLWPYHYHFALARLPGYAGMSLLEYNRQALYADANQRMVVGSVLRAEAVQRRLVLDEGWRIFYMPSAEQRAAAEAGASDLAARGILLDSLSRWAGENADDGCRITLTDTTGLLTPERRQEILDSKKGGPLDITPKACAGAISLPVDPLWPHDIQYVGGKAANFGFLRRSPPDNTATPVIAFTFDLWDAYLAQTLPGGKTLGQEIGDRLGAYTYPPDVNSLRADLAVVQELITDTADFDAAQQVRILAALQEVKFEDLRKIRFRSSTNVEDAETFSGAGLYDSYSGCLADDLDGDNAGPSRCDPSQPKERGVFRAMRKVYASFYNENAFLERLRYGIDESIVGMAILVHYSSPDPDEMANGVALLAIDKADGLRRASARIVTQLGAESVTNPDPTIRPETVTASYSGADTADAVLTLVEASSLTPDGEPVMPWEDDYRILLHQMNTATLAYEEYYEDKTVFELDFEFKRMVPGDVGLKQIRAVPHPVPVPPPTIP